jgi:hypothetical protein
MKWHLHKFLLYLLMMVAVFVTRTFNPPQHANGKIIFTNQLTTHRVQTDLSNVVFAGG